MTAGPGDLIVGFAPLPPFWLLQSSFPPLEVARCDSLFHHVFDLLFAGRRVSFGGAPRIWSSWSLLNGED